MNKLVKCLPAILFLQLFISACNTSDPNNNKTIFNLNLNDGLSSLDPAFARKALKGVPLGRLQTAEQVAEAAVFLGSEQAASVTGVTLLVDGGLSLFKYE